MERIPGLKALILASALSIAACASSPNTAPASDSTLQHATLHDAFAAYNKGDIATARKIWSFLAEKGDKDAQFNLGLLYEQGEGVAQDYGEALKWYRKAAAQGDPSAECVLGSMYRDGEGVPQDYAEAFKWYRKAAEHKVPAGKSLKGFTEQDIPIARDYLGALYRDGRGVQRDYVQAYMWFSLAVEAGSEVSAKNRDFVALMMSPEEVAAAQKLAKEWTPPAA